MKRCRFAVCVMLLVALWAAPAVADQLDAVCRVRVPAAKAREEFSGTGTVFAIGDQYVFVLTCAHVVGNNQTAKFDFWKQGYQSSTLRGQIYAADRAIDAAVALIPKGAFGGILPTAIPLGEASDAPQPGATIRSAGCSKGGWASAWKGHIVGYDRQGNFAFVPVPLGGRSGSAITNEAGDRIVGLLKWGDPDGEGKVDVGGATDIAALTGRMYPAMHIAAQNFQLCGAILNQNQEAQCGPNGCPSGNCPLIQGPLLQGGIFNRGKQQQQQQQQQNPQKDGMGAWPGLPAPAPASPPVDLSPILQQQQSQSELIRQILERQSQPIPVVPIPPSSAAPPIDQEARAAIDKTVARVDGLTDATKQLGTAIDAHGKQIATIAEAVGPLVKIREKLEADAEAGGLKGKLAQKLLDAGGGDDSLRKVLITGGIILTVLFVGTLMVLHTMRTGKGPVHTIVEKIAERHPDNERLAALHTKMESIDARLAGIGGHAASLGLGAATGGLPGVRVAAGIDVAQQIKDHMTALFTQPPGQPQAAPSPSAAPPATVVNVAPAPSATDK